MKRIEDMTLSERVGRLEGQVARLLQVLERLIETDLEMTKFELAEIESANTQPSNG